jgi:hypothetical protein
VVVADGVGAAGQIVERVAVRRERQRDAVEVGDPLQALEELVEGVGPGHQPRDVGGDGGQHVVAGEDDPVGGIEQAQVVVGVARGVQGHPVAAGELDDVGVVDAAGRRGCAHEPLERDPEGAELQPALQRRPEGGVGAPGHRPSER